MNRKETKPSLVLATYQ